MIDWDRVNTLRDDVGEEDFEEVVSLFLDEVDGVIERLRVANDQSTLGADLHFLKGSAMGLGFVAFADLCQAGETACEAATDAKVDLDSILTAYFNSKILFLEEMPIALAG